MKKQLWMMLLVAFVVSITVGVASAEGDGIRSSTFKGYTFEEYIHGAKNMERLQKRAADEADDRLVYGEVLMTSEAVRFMVQPKNEGGEIKLHEFDLQQHMWRDAYAVNSSDVPTDQVVWAMKDVDWKMVPKVVKDAEKYVKGTEYKNADIKSVRFSKSRIVVQFENIKDSTKEVLYIASPDGKLIGFGVGEVTVDGVEIIEEVIPKK